MRLYRAALAAGVAALCAVAGGSASAHPMPHSVVLLDVDRDSVTAELRVPVGDLEAASGLDPADQPGVRDYLLAHVRPASGGRAWSVAVRNLAVGAAEQTATGPYRELVARLVLTPPAGASTRRFTLAYDVVVHQVVTHTALVSVRADRTGSAAGRELGAVAVDNRTMAVPALAIDLDTRGWQAFSDMLALGGHHIAEGTDHLLFLLTLLLPAPLLRAGRRWGTAAGPRAAAAAIVRVTVAFTAGHSVTLVFSALGRFELPAGPVEALIAISILVSAAHAIRPVVPGREALVAGGFGLVHGMAFASTLAERSLSSPELVVSLLGFNLGIELVQLLVVALVLPPLVVLARHDSAYRALRTGGAALAGAAAIGWLLARLGLPTPLGPAADALSAHLGWVVVPLWAAAVVGLLRRAPAPADT
jgi:hypothetical protein